MEFGEVQIESSRAFWDDYDEIGEERQEFPALEWVWQNEDNTAQFPAQLDTFLVVEGSTIHVMDFFNAVLLKSRSPLCHLKVGQASIFDFPEQKLAVCVVDEKDLNYFTPITQMLEPWIKAAQNVYCCTFQSASTYKGEEVFESVDGCFVRAVNSTVNYVKELEVPNIVTGVAAGVVSYCKLQTQAASCFVIYMESPIFDSITTRPMIRLLKDLKIPCDDKFVFTKHKPSSSLYL